MSNLQVITSFFFALSIKCILHSIQTTEFVGMKLLVLSTLSLVIAVSANPCSDAKMSAVRNSPAPHVTTTPNDTHQRPCGAFSEPVTWSHRGLVCEACDQWHQTSTQRFNRELYTHSLSSNIAVPVGILLCVENQMLIQLLLICVRYRFREDVLCF